jgi:hypothetical protein
LIFEIFLTAVLSAVGIAKAEALAKAGCVLPDRRFIRRRHREGGSLGVGWLWLNKSEVTGNPKKIHKTTGV